MVIMFQCKCGRPLRANADAAGKRTKCPGCNQLLTIPAAAGKAAPVAVAVAASAAPATSAAAHPVAASVATGDPFAPELDWSTLEAPRHAEIDPLRSNSGIIKIDMAVADVPVAEIPRPEDGSRQYHVLTQKDQGFTGKFNAAKLEELLNSHARQGWCLKAAVAMNMPGHGGNHDELILILER